MEYFACMRLISPEVPRLQFELGLGHCPPCHKPVGGFHTSGPSMDANAPYTSHDYAKKGKSHICSQSRIHAEDSSIWFLV